MSEKNIKPSVVEKVTEELDNILDQMEKLGLTRRDLKMLIRDRTSNKVNMSDVEAVLLAIERIEKQFRKAQKAKK
jgi:hypothetical protein